MTAGAGPRTVVAHQDDVGMNHGANVAFVELSAAGAITCGSAMVPCPWFPEVARWAAQNPGLDLGVHLTLTSEKPHYRWGPLTRPSPTAGLTDPDGYLWPDVAALRRHAHPDAVEAELRAQLERALATGYDVTHLDAHMGGALAPEWCGAYVRLGVEHRLPVLLTRDLDSYGPHRPHLRGVAAEAFAELVHQADSAGLPLFDLVLETDFTRPPGATADEVQRQLFNRIGDGLTFLALHPNAPGEIEVIEPDQAHVRIDEYTALRSASFRAWRDGLDVEWIGMRRLRDQLRAA